MKIIIAKKSEPDMNTLKDNKRTLTSEERKQVINAYDFIETTSNFNGEIKMADSLFKIAGRKRIKDRGINWKEHYHERSVKLKKRFDKQLGPSSYLRWEGHDFTTNSNYFIVVGPAMTKDLKKKFFAGIKKLPHDAKATIYAPSGKYFDSITDAMGHANDKWGVPFPKNPALPKYTVMDLAKIEIPRHVKGSAENITKEG